MASPPHLSPFVDNEQQGYLPDRQREINSLKGIKQEIVESSEGEESDEQDK